MRPLHLDLGKIQSFFFLRRKQCWLHGLSARKAYLYTSSSKKNLMTGQLEPFDPGEIRSVLEQVDSKKVEDHLRVFHLFYELGSSIQGANLRPNVPLMIFIEYQKFETITVPKTKGPSEFSINTQRNISYKQYKKAFTGVQRHLKNGDCYQANLTFMHHLRYPELLAEKVLLHFLSNIGQRSAYSHVTFFPKYISGLISNSPECLFEVDKESRKIWSMPIKGTVLLQTDEKEEVEKKWSELRYDLKNQAELFMITDLLRNDLAKVSEHFSDAIVMRPKKKLVVPKLLHQYSVVQGKLKSHWNLWNLCCALFPGGSITGAPKNRVMGILQNLEIQPRGFYTGSTILDYGNRLSCSINIRSAEWDLVQKTFRYGAGGGITLQSKVDLEWSEMHRKVESFIQSF